MLDRGSNINLTRESKIPLTSVFFWQYDNNLINIIDEMAKFLLKTIKISKRRNVKRPLGHTKRPINKKTKKINQISKNNCSLAKILNEKAFIKSIPNIREVDHNIHTDIDSYKYAYQTDQENTDNIPNSEVSDMSIDVDEKQPLFNENEINDIFDSLINDASHQ